VAASRGFTGTYNPVASEPEPRPSTAFTAVSNRLKAEQVPAARRFREPLFARGLKVVALWRTDDEGDQKTPPTIAAPWERLLWVRNATNGKIVPTSDITGLFDALMSACNPFKSTVGPACWQYCDKRVLSRPQFKEFNNFTAA
jgi:hypothetical protein